MLTEVGVLALADGQNNNEMIQIKATAICSVSLIMSGGINTKNN